PRRGRAVSENQASLDFLPPTTAPKKLSTTVDAKVYCDAPVADVPHRVVASVLDWMAVMAGYVMFLIAYRVLGGEFNVGSIAANGDFMVNKVNVAVLLGMWLVIAFAYGAIWTIAGRENAGMN